MKHVSIISISLLFLLISCSIKAQISIEKQKLEIIENTRYLDSLFKRYYKGPVITIDHKSEEEFYKIGKFKLLDSIQSIKLKMNAEPLAIEKWYRYDAGDAYLAIYDKITFTMIRGRAHRIITMRDDLLTPLGIHVGMNINDFKGKLTNVEIKPTKDGIVLIGPGGEPSYYLMYIVINEIVRAICLMIVPE